MSIIISTNNAISTLAFPITNVATSATLSSGAGALFPNPSAGQYFALTFIDATTQLIREIVYCTARAGDALTITRAQEGTAALAWNAGDLAQNQMTAATLAALWQTAATLGGVLTGTLPNPGMAGGAAAGNVGTLGGVLTGSLPNPGLAAGAAVANIGYTPINKAGDSGIGGLSAAALTSLAGIFATANIVTGSGRFRASFGVDLADGNSVPILNDFFNSISTFGYQKLPSGFFIQWGTNGTGNGVPVTFPLAFPNAGLCVVTSEAQANVTWGSNLPTVHGTSNVTTTQFLHWTLTWNGSGFIPAGNTCSWIAIGV